MKCFFETCHEAVAATTQTKSFGIFFSEESNPTQHVHVHDCCEIFLALEGGSTFLVDDKVYDIQNGDLFIINQFEAHKVVASKNGKFTRYILHVHPAFIYANSQGDVSLAPCFYSTNKITKLSPSAADLARLVSLFEDMRCEREYGDEIYKRLRATEILLEINRVFATHGAAKSNAFRHKAVQLAIDHINSNYASVLSLEDVAKNAFVSPAQLSRLFGRYCGTTVTKYIAGKRITEAKKMLAEGRSVTDTALSCGFNDYANFIRTFKRAVGVPPGKYRTQIL
ncbi:MAG: helix-turn-helix transcriptional regulator [Clostridia bacterium]|nr:helix-turn-helix transcriptional regulator [Clostridia bacterium]